HRALPSFPTRRSSDLISGPCLDHLGHWSRKGLSLAHIRQFFRSWYIGAFHLPVLAPLFWRLYLGPRWGGVLKRLEGVEVKPARRSEEHTSELQSQSNL